MQKSDYVLIAKLILVWLAALFSILFIATRFIPIQTNFLGGGMGNYINNPYVWVWGNFDGEHYLAIAQNGYRPLTYFFFPLYPLIIKFFSIFVGSSLFSLLTSGFFVSLFSLAAGLVGFIKLLGIDFKKNIVLISVALLLLFPTSFYFVSIYTESLFFALSIWFFYFTRHKKYLIAAVFSGFATATRVIGITLPLCLLIEMLVNKENIFKFKNIFSLILSTSGIVIYMFYLKNATGSYLEFFNTISIFGGQRESAFILLPQVLYRYIFKILPGLHSTYFPVLFTTYMEFITGLLFLAFSIIGFFRLRLSYAVYLALGYLIPTFSGSFSSMPRYVLILFPAYILIAQFFIKRKRLLFAFGFLSFILLFISFALFARGYWIA